MKFVDESGLHVMKEYAPSQLHEVKSEQVRLHAPQYLCKCLPKNWPNLFSRHQLRHSRLWHSQGLHKILFSGKMCQVLQYTKLMPHSMQHSKKQRGGLMNLYDLHDESEASPERPEHFVFDNAVHNFQPKFHGACSRYYSVAPGVDTTH